MCTGCNDYALSRRRFLSNSAAAVATLAYADPILRLVSQAYAQTSQGTGNLLVLCQLDGGLDALSFLAPFTNPVYQAKRPQLALKADQVVPLSDNPDYGINTQFQFFADLYQAGQLAIIQQVAFPDGNGSHFESQEVFEYGVRNLGGAGAGVPWYERLRKTYFDEPYGVLNTQTIGDPRRYGYPDRTYHRAAQEAFGRLARLSKQGRSGAQQEVLAAYDRIDQRGQVLRERTQNFESTGEARDDFYRAAMLASAGLGTRIIKLRYGGFDTHGSQDEAQAQLFPTLNDHFRQFVDDARNIGIWDRTAVLFYTEFGRRNEENGSPGTDHGYGGHMMLAGPHVSGGLKGQPVTTADLNQDNLPYYVDFRAVLGATIRDWLGLDPAPIFKLDGESYDENVGSPLFA